MSKKSYSNIIKNTVSSLPYFRIEDVFLLGGRSIEYLRTTLLRLKKRGDIVSLKRGEYVSRKYLNNIEKTNKKNSYLEFIATNMYEPSYLSLEYILSEHSILSENVNSFTLISRNKTKKFINELGVFVYKHIKDELFIGFNIKKKDGFFIAKASLAKSLFDFLYLRKNIISNKDSFLELRLNIEILKKKDIREFKKYVEIEGSKSMKMIYNYLFEAWEKKK